MLNIGDRVVDTYGEVGTVIHLSASIYGGRFVEVEYDEDEPRGVGKMKDAWLEHQLKLKE